MKLLCACVIITLCFLILMTGCTSQTGSNPAIAKPTANPTVIQTMNQTEVPTPLPTHITDPLLYGTWYLKLMSEQNGTAQVQMMNPQITVLFDEQNISGYSGCNNYYGQYTLTSVVLSNGKGISIQPLTSTMMFCADSANTETTYMQILQGASSYLVNTNQELSIMDESGNVLVYQRTPYSETAVPKGV